MHSNKQRRKYKKKDDFIEDQSDDGSESWEIDSSRESPDEYIKEYSSDAEEMKMPKKRIRKKGRKARFLVDQMLLDQQLQSKPNFSNSIDSQQQQINSYSLYQGDQNIIIPPAISHLESKNGPSLPKLETVRENYVPQAFDPIPRGNKF